MCRCGLCTLDRVRTHFCTVCGRAHWTALQAEDCHGDDDISSDDFEVHRG